MTENPCAAYADKPTITIPRTPEEVQKNKPKAETPKKINQWDVVAEGKEAIKNYIKNTDWLVELSKKLHLSDFQDFVGQTYQHKLAHSYLQKIGIFKFLTILNNF